MDNVKEEFIDKPAIQIFNEKTLPESGGEHDLKFKNNNLTTHEVQRSESPKKAENLTKSDKIASKKIKKFKSVKNPAPKKARKN